MRRALSLSIENILFIETNTSLFELNKKDERIRNFCHELMNNNRIILHLKFKQKEPWDDNATYECYVIFMFAQTEIFRRQHWKCFGGGKTTSICLLCVISKIIIAGSGSVLNFNGFTNSSLYLLHKISFLHFGSTQGFHFSKIIRISFIFIGPISINLFEN